jgi:hypothetical protein
MKLHTPAFGVLAALSLALPILLAIPVDSSAVPAFSRQTGMNCNSCHVGTYPTPRFTQTGMLFAARGYTRPYVSERLNHPGQDATDKDDSTQDQEGERYGGNYLALNWDNYFSGRFLTSIYTGGENAAGVDADHTSQATNRFAMFFTGAITDWLGLWTEIGYLGNQSINTVGADATSTGRNWFAYDEYRLSAAWDLDPKGFFGPRSFWGISVGNEHPYVNAQFNFGRGGNVWAHGQGGTGNHFEITNISLNSFTFGRVWAQFAAVTGAHNNNWSNGWNQYIALGYNVTHDQQNDTWILLDFYMGNDMPSIMRPFTRSALCPTTCPAGISDANFRTSNTPGGAPIVGAPIEQADDFFASRVSISNSAADRGVNSWYSDVGISQIKQDFVSGAKVERTYGGGEIRYFYNRTYGLEFVWNKNFEYKYTTASGQVRKAVTKDDMAVAFLFYPAMNFNFRLLYDPRADNNIVFEDQRELQVSGGYSYNLTVEYNF